MEGMRGTVNCVKGGSEEIDNMRVEMAGGRRGVQRGRCLLCLFLVAMKGLRIMVRTRVG